MTIGVTGKRAFMLASGAVLLFACGLDVLGTGPADGGSDADVAGDGAITEGASSADGGGGDSAIADGAIVDGAKADAYVDPYSKRVTTGLYALYELEENAGATVHDAIAAPYDLTIDDPSKVTWHPHYVEFKDYTSLANTADFAKLVTQGASHEVTIEAWVKITAVSGGNGNYGRLVSIIDDATNRNIDMGLHGTNLWASLESADTLIEKGPVAVALAHVVLTRTASDQTLRLYLNGALFSSAPNVGDPASFASYPMVVANSPNGDRGIKGELHLLAFYSAALTPAQIATNYAAGPDPAK